MAQFFKAKPNKTKQLSAKLTLTVSQLDHLGAGIAQHDGKVVFIPGALPGETVTAQLIEQKKKYAKAKLLKIQIATDKRVAAQCPHYQQCGGCDLQHMSIDAQREYKQDALQNLMGKLAVNIDDKIMTSMITGEQWHYRRRARLATLFDKKTKHLQLGFRAANSNNIVDIKQCDVLAVALSALIEPFSNVLNQLQAKMTLGHLELTEAENGIFAVLRITKALKTDDEQRLKAFALEHQIQLLVQDNDGELRSLVSDDHIELPKYLLANGQVECRFSPGNFVQVNADINQRMVAQAIEWLDPQQDERILDLFCGVGNFSLPLATQAADVIGVEGVPEMVTQAKQNAADNNLTNLSFFHADLSADLSQASWLGKIDKLLLDPARAGAYESLQWLSKMKPKKVVYVSCNPASLARDSQVLIEQGYQLKKLTMLDMFPQTHHIEAMALFEIK
ncbi:MULTISPECIES: 23S rRNA (uracil(1939)-C(5))-methyltransferase RlmD [unclassified Shewanella]|uniref:23S rRNA (uracil(1939)-C(5))-methyltransferase RlmD n=1 Tax=unclassified Shewanella TaxID=196818 RepID=UPI000C84FD57|nr:MULTISPECIES: 23S rRNA (uracil(1939)-C(5))-methyltransferase RlmD [unclassified Shewanella]MDO6640109.1 23S rRNA (uracil(1939)-C(5))-methyltransferase RlmD [Shewanella sp. 5_MG-2023]MDO6774955.1 23S rRNA (uracil(1939)-C(5))-methyltransferase RlmD [Shewanella sp. 3_MG-2023]PMG27002.1 23S rRNA (uracil(1939)-C(5))-methyltransferase RlmD [Shewanella sp. 10N.286.52.C2]PMG40287.1 23S rRNA (uracil(1939)-C(5))-methyltransferase RlmD [Shewanella sp. 10N.286.52.B9]PMH87142.1 23S rRNA (uracil(1939)-C(